MADLQKKPHTMTITLKVVDPDEFADALREVLRLVDDGNTSGHGENEYTAFTFKTGEVMPAEVKPPEAMTKTFRSAGTR